MKTQYSGKTKIMLAIVFLTVLLLPVLCLSQVQTLGTYKVNDCVDLKQICANCTFSNITSVVSPNTTILLTNTQMQKIGTEYNYTFCNTSIIGDYTVNGVSDVDGINTVWVYDFMVTPNGFQLSVGQSMLYIFGIILTSAIFILLLFPAIKIPLKNSKNAEGKVISINNLKWFKVGAIALDYVVLIFVFALAEAITRDYLYTLAIYQFFNWGYTILYAMAYPLAIIAIVLGLVTFIHDIYAKKKLTRRYWR